MNTQFSCNATAGDHCLSIEEVNAMTESHEEHAGVWRERVHAVSIKKARTQLKLSGITSNTHTIWVAPWTDKQGIRHQDDTLYAVITTPSNRG
jgi:hypothetical protein